jgi:hypothetical protein
LSGQLSDLPYAERTQSNRQEGLPAAAAYDDRFMVLFVSSQQQGDDILPYFSGKT